MRSLIRRVTKKDVPHDPAPSKWGYRYQRLMLTPVFRAFVRVGVPIFMVVVILLSWFSHEANRAALQGQIAIVKEGFQERPQFMVHSMTVTGAPSDVIAEVSALLPDTFPISSFEIDLETTRQTLEALDSVGTASVRVGQDSVLEVGIIPRVPVALWRDGEILRLIDDTGAQSGIVAARADRLDLPLIAGAGAQKEIQEALALFAGAGPISDRVRGLVRMGERRWDMVLDRGQRILLPAEDAVAALDRIVVLSAAQDMLARDVAIVDMRNAERPTLRMSEEATMAMRRSTAFTNDNNGADN